MALGRYLDLNETMPQVAVLVRQDGGSYGWFTCPFCDERAYYNFKTVCGGCEGCGTNFYSAGGFSIPLGDGEGVYCSYWMALAVDWDFSSDSNSYSEGLA